MLHTPRCTGVNQLQPTSHINMVPNPKPVYLAFQPHFVSHISSTFLGYEAQKKLLVSSCPGKWEQPLYLHLLLLLLFMRRPPRLCTCSWAVIWNQEQHWCETHDPTVLKVTAGPSFARQSVSPYLLWRAQQTPSTSVDMSPGTCQFSDQSWGLA